MRVEFPNVELTMTANEAYNIGCHLIYSITSEYNAKCIKCTPNQTEETWRDRNKEIIGIALRLMSPINQNYGESLIKKFCDEVFNDD